MYGVCRLYLDCLRYKFSILLQTLVGSDDSE